MLMWTTKLEYLIIGGFNLYKCKYDTVESAITLIFMPDFLIFFFGIVFTIIALITNQIDLSIVPWLVYVLVGCFLLSTHLTYLFLYIFTKKHCQCDEDNIVLSNRREIKNISKDQIESIRYSRVSIFFATLAYEDYGSVTICCNEKGGYEILRFKVFPGVIRYLRKMGYPVEYISCWKWKS